MAKRKGRRARGTGSIFKSEAKGVWIGRRTVGKDAKGKPVRVEVWGDTQAEVVRKLAAAGPAGPETTVSQWADLWMAGLDVRPPTRALYKRSLRLYIIPLLGTIQVKNLTINRVEVFGADLVKRGLKATTARLVMAHLRTMCTAALRDRLIDVNPCASARKPRGASKRLEPYPVSDLSRIIAHAPTYTPRRHHRPPGGLRVSGRRSHRARRARLRPGGGDDLDHKNVDTKAGGGSAKVETQHSDNSSSRQCGSDPSRCCGEPPGRPAVRFVGEQPSRSCLGARCLDAGLS